MNFNILCKALFFFTLGLVLVNCEQPANTQTLILQLRSKLGTCLDANTGQAGRVPYMRVCDNGANLNLRWVPVNAGSNSFFIKTSVTGLCLDANTGQSGRNVYLRTCDSSNNNLKWYSYTPNSRPIGEAQLRTRTTGYCLDANTGQSGRVPYMRVCDSGQNNNLIWIWTSVN